MKTQFVPKEAVERKWYLIDAEGLILGRMAARIATMLQGKHKPCYTPNTDTGDFIIVVNAKKIAVTGNKLDTKMYKRYSGYPGGQKVRPMREEMEKHPERIITEAVRRMLPKSRMGRAMLKKLKVFAGPNHPHEAQQPETLALQEKSVNG
jgi:large subunit ribosomal protein L13